MCGSFPKTSTSFPDAITSSSSSWQNYSLVGVWGERKGGPTNSPALVPSAYHHARWMSKALYILKLDLLAHQLNQTQLSWQKKHKVHLLALWVVFCYMEYWLRSPSLEDSAYNDLQLGSNSSPLS